jgi:hypothetical protein
LVPVLYSFVVLDLKLIRWEGAEKSTPAAHEVHAAAPAASEVLV